MALNVGDTVAGYIVVGPLAAGRTGEVYLVKHPRLPRQDALKVLTAELSGDPVFAERFTREADAAATLWHPHIVGVHDRGSDGGRLWLAMDHVDGTDTGRLLTENHPDGLPAAEVAEIVTAAAAALDYARGQGVVHRRLNPSNILVGTTGGRRIALTGVGMSGPDGPATDDDQYALAATTAWLLLGHPQRAGFALADERPELAAVDAIVDRAQATGAANRYPDCAAFAAALTGALSSGAPAAAPTAAAPTASADWWADAAPPEPDEPPVISYWTPEATPSAAPTAAAPTAGPPMSGPPMSSAPIPSAPTVMAAGPVPAYSGPYPTPAVSAWPIPPALLAILAVVGILAVAVLTYAVLSNLA